MYQPCLISIPRAKKLLSGGIRQACIGGKGPLKTSFADIFPCGRNGTRLLAFGSPCRNAQFGCKFRLCLRSFCCLQICDHRCADTLRHFGTVKLNIQIRLEKTSLEQGSMLDYDCQSSRSETERCCLNHQDWRLRSSRVGKRVYWSKSGEVGLPNLRCNF